MHYARLVARPQVTLNKKVYTCWSRFVRRGSVLLWCFSTRFCIQKQTTETHQCSGRGTIIVSLVLIWLEYQTKPVFIFAPCILKIHWLLNTNKCTIIYCGYSKIHIKTLKKLLHVSVYRSPSGSIRSSLLKLYVTVIIKTIRYFNRCCGSISINKLFAMNHWYNIIKHTYLLTYLLTPSMEQSPPWEANQFLARQQILRILWNTKFNYRIH
jgi:hypothetical protein